MGFFDKVAENDNLSHAYCFVGPESVGKRTVAEHVSASILQVETSKLMLQPDFNLVEQEPNEKTGKTKRNIDIEQIRNLRAVLARRSFLGGYKTAIIDKADKMNSSSANGLLKTLEEPKDKTIVFLLTKDEKLLPQTIQSRCQMIYFEPVADKEIQKYLDSKGLEDAIEMANLSMGLPGQAINWFKDRELYASHKAEMGRFVSLFGQPFFEKLKKTDDLFGDKTDHIAAREKLHHTLGLWQLALRDFIYKNHNNDEDISKRNILSITKKIEQARGLLKKNVHPRILIENILLEIN